jgi:anthranilate phosphoribosyltransferase
MVVHGADGMDEISFSGDTYVAELRDGKIREYTLNPQQFDMPVHQLAQIQIADATSSKQMLLSVLQGEQTPARDIVLLNAGAAIYVSGLAADLAAGIQRAAQVIDAGLALEKLQALVALSQSLASNTKSA